MIHHIAIGSHQVTALATFYLKLPHAIFVLENKGEKNGTIRSVWIKFGEITLMIEEGQKEAPKALVFSFEEEDRTLWNKFLENTPIENKTMYTRYFSDPDGNLLGISTHPDEIVV